MRTTRRELNLYSFYDHTGMERHLEEMAEKGWMIEKLGGLWRYRRCEPKRLRFCVTYYPEASEYDPATPSEGEQTFWDYCASAGWVKVAHRAQTHVFCNEDESAVPIETEASVQVDTLHRAAKKSYLPSQWCLLALAVYYLVRSVYSIIRDPLDELSNPNTFIFLATYLLLLLLCTCELVSYSRWRKRAVRAADELGRFTPTRSHRSLTRGVSWLMAANAVSVVVMNIEDGHLFLFMLLCFGVLTALVQLLKAVLRRKNVATDTARGITVAVAVVLSMVYAALLFSGAINGWFSVAPENADPYEYRYGYGDGEVCNTYYAYHDELPFYVEELTGTDYDRYSCKCTAQSSPLLSKTRYRQETRWGDWDDAPELSCIVYDVKFSPLFDLFLNDLLNEYADRKYSAFVYRTVDAAPWSADSAYRLYDPEDDLDFNTWVLTYGDRIAVFAANGFVPDEAAIALVGERLAR